MATSEWISATSCYNYMLKDPVIDWYESHYHKGVSRKRKRSSDGGTPDPFVSYIMEQGNVFERKIMKIITKKFEPHRIAEIHGEQNPRDYAKVEETIIAMRKGIPIIHSGVLHNP